jgi:hypothetical protein
VKYPVVCECCGSSRLKRSRHTGGLERVKMMIGTYPFRCLDCNTRFPVNVFLLSRLGFAKCPKCLSLDVSNTAKKVSRVRGVGKLMLIFGARRCRCKNCRYMFVSFRPVAP